MVPAVSDRGRRGEESEATRLRLLEAGLAELRDEPPSALFANLQARPISARAGLTTGAFYHHFPGPDQYVEALLQYSLNADRAPEFAAALSAYEPAVQAGTSFTAALIAGASELMRYRDQDYVFRLAMAVWSRMHGDRAAQQRIATMYSMA